MSELIVIVFTDRYRAPEVLNELRRRNVPWRRALDTAVAVTLDENAKASVLMTVDLSKREAVRWAGVWGALLQATVFAPLTEAMVEAADKIACPSVQLGCSPTNQGEECEEFKWWHDVLDSSTNFRRDVSALVGANTSAILMMLNTPQLAAALKQLHNYGNTIVHMTISQHHQEQLDLMLARK